MEIDVQGIKDDESLFHELVNRKAILLADWSGEDKEGMLYHFFNNRLQSMHEESIYQFPKKMSIKSLIKRQKNPNEVISFPLHYPILISS